MPTGGHTLMRGVNILGRWTRTTSESSNFSLQTYFDQTRISDAVPALLLGNIPVTPSGTLHDNLRTFDVDFQQRFRLGTLHGITWGAGFRQTDDGADSAPALAFLPGNLSQQLYSAFLQDEIRMSEALSLTVGTKLEHNLYTGLEVEPNLRLQWHPYPDQTFWSAVSRAVRTPSRIDHDLREAAPPYLQLLQGRSTFTSEDVLAYEIGHRAQVSPRLATSVALFFNEYSNVRSTSITPATILPFYSPTTWKATRTVWNSPATCS